MTVDVYVGIDLACRAAKRLPLCVMAGRGTLNPLEIPKAMPNAIPRGTGNREVLAPAPFGQAARGVAAALVRIAEEMGWSIKGVAIDAPAAPPTSGSGRSEG